MRKVSFDFDGTLSKESVQKYAKELFDKGFEVWIVTLRFENHLNDKLYGKDYNNEDLYAIADQIGIKREHIVFTALVDKGEYFSKHDDFIFHLDDSYPQIKDVTEKCVNTKPVWLFNFSLDQLKWVEECNELIKTISA